MSGYEQLGLFYLGKRYDVDTQTRTSEPILYDSKDLVTHAMCVGMTGSGKTGLGITLIEEAAIELVIQLIDVLLNRRAFDPQAELADLLAEHAADLGIERLEPGHPAIIFAFRAVTREHTGAATRL